MRIDYQKYRIENDKDIYTKIVHISDIHFAHNYKIKRLEIIKKKIEKIKPNYICITGDLIDIYDVVNDTNFTDFTNWLNELSKIAKLIISIGNHEYVKIKNNCYGKTSDIEWVKKLKNDNIIVLDNEVYNDLSITFIGYNPEYEYYYKYLEKDPLSNNNEISKLINKAKEKYIILLLHTPMLILYNDNYKNIRDFNKIDLVLCGHTHGGLIPSFVPGNFGIISPSRELFPKKVRGIFYLENCRVIISSGVMKLSRKSKLTYLNDIYGSNIIEINIENGIN